MTCNCLRSQDCCGLFHSDQWGFVHLPKGVFFPSNQWLRSHACSCIISMYWLLPTTIRWWTTNSFGSRLDWFAYFFPQTFSITGNHITVNHQNFFSFDGKHRISICKRFRKASRFPRPLLLRQCSCETMKCAWLRCPKIWMQPGGLAKWIETKNLLGSAVPVMSGYIYI